MKKNWSAIIPAAGNSKRFKYRLSKIFYKIKKKTLIEIIINKISDYSDNIILIIIIIRKIIINYHWGM